MSYHPLKPQPVPPLYSEAAMPQSDLGIKHGQCTLIHGASGTGKTHICWALIRHLSPSWPSLHPSRRPWMVHEMTHMDKIWDNGWIHDLCDWPGVLIVDDLGYRCHADQLPHEWLQHCAYAIADQRGSWKRTTIVTTNLDRDRMAHSYGNMVASRLFTHAIKLGGKDRRLAK